MFEPLLAQLAIVAAFVKKVVDLLKPVYAGHPKQAAFDTILSLVASGVLCVVWGIDAFAVVGIAFTWDWVGPLFTGAFAALGSNVLNDILKLLEMWKERNKVRG